jgi:ribosomal protein S18 acetylase RimI-like enzyme
MKIILATIDLLEEVSQLFDRYRMFYQQPTDLDAARKFITARLENGDSTIFVAINGDRAIGFTQLYPSFSSVSMQPILILNDLFIEDSDRRRGVAKLLMSAAVNFARENSVIRLSLSTQISNTAAQSLYRSLGYIQDETFQHYSLSIAL